MTAPSSPRLKLETELPSMILDSAFKVWYARVEQTLQGRFFSADYRGECAAGDGTRQLGGRGVGGHIFEI
ncbi:MAG: hypothetical protein ACFCBU_16580 [Cyanophyceae cyanobacterium]